MSLSKIKADCCNEQQPVIQSHIQQLDASCEDEAQSYKTSGMGNNMEQLKDEQSIACGKANVRIHNIAYSEDEGPDCSICDDKLEMKGDHRLVALNCGHLFGDSCIRSVLTKSARKSGVQTCPICNKSASIKGIRYLSAQRVRGIEPSDEASRLRAELDEERCRVNALKAQLSREKYMSGALKYLVAAKKLENKYLSEYLNA